MHIIVNMGSIEEKLAGYCTGSDQPKPTDSTMYSRIQIKLANNMWKWHPYVRPGEGGKDKGELLNADKTQLMINAKCGE